MKRVLVIAYYWPPSGGSGVQRWVKMCKYLPSFGWTPVVYTPEDPAVTSTDLSLLEDIDPLLEVLKQPIVEPGKFAGKTTSSTVTPINSSSKGLKQRLMMWIRANVFIPDPRVVWVRPSVKFLKKYLKEHPVDAIISTGPPHSMHLIARKLSMDTGIPWVADFRDPWTKMYYLKYLPLTGRSRRAQENMEASVLREASRIVAVTPLMKEDFGAMTTTPVEMITNGYDEGDFPASMPSAGSDNNGLFTLLHAGLLASDGNPVQLWKALGEMTAENPLFASRLRLQLCGKTDAAVLESIREAGLEHYVDNVGYQPHDKVVRLMRNASALLLPLRNAAEYRPIIPGKTFEYLASRRPVMGIGQKDGAMAAVLEDAGAGETFEWEDKDGMKAWMEDKFRKFIAGELDDNASSPEKYSRRNLARQFAALLDDISI